MTNFCGYFINNLKPVSTLAEANFLISKPKQNSKFSNFKRNFLQIDKKFTNLSNLNQKCAFTLAEVLITLGIIGVVAAMTLPTLINQYEKKMTVVKLKKAYNTIANVAQRSYLDNEITYSGSVTTDKAKEYFDKYWLPYLNNPKVSPNGTHPYGKANPYLNRDGSNDVTGIYTSYPQGRIFFTTSEGISYFVRAMDWQRDTEGNAIIGSQYFSPTQQVYIDLNGIKPPNTLGKDVFIFTIFFNENVVRPYGYNYSKSTINTSCKTTGTYCAAKIIADGWEIKDDYLW